MSYPINQQMLAALMDTIPDRIYFKDNAGRFLSINQAFLNYLQLEKPEDLLGKTDFDVFQHDHAVEAFNDEQQLIQTGESIVAKIECEILPNGHIGWVSTTKVPMRDSNGVIIGTCGISRDITEEHDRAEKLKEYTAVLAEQQKEMEEELVLAREIQSALLPSDFPVFPKNASCAESLLQFYRLYLPADEVGGDFFSVQQLSDSKAGVLICDVMGHGVHAALITAIQRVLVEALEPWAHDPGAFMGEFNRRICKLLQRVKTQLFVTSCYLTIDSSNGCVQAANAGHPYPLHIKRDLNEVRSMKAPGGHSLPLGMMEDSVYETSQEMISPGDSLLLFTDGLSDLSGPNEFEFDEKDLLQVVREAVHPGVKGESLLNEIVQKIKEKAHSESFEDDVCLLGIDWQNPNILSSFERF